MAFIIFLASTNANVILLFLPSYSFDILWILIAAYLKVVIQYCKSFHTVHIMLTQF